MLRSLSIRDIVLIERLELEVRPGLSVLTGETGAGKSIILDALGLALGGRGDRGLVRAGADQGGVTAEFELPPGHPARGLLAENDHRLEDELVVLRTVTADGRSRAFVNDTAVSTGLLRQLGDLLVEVHGQFDQRGLLDARNHRASLDAFGGLEPPLAEARERLARTGGRPGAAGRPQQGDRGGAARGGLSAPPRARACRPRRRAGRGGGAGAAPSAPGPPREARDRVARGAGRTIRLRRRGRADRARAERRLERSAGLAPEMLEPRSRRWAGR